MDKSEILNRISNCIIACENCANLCLAEDPAKMASCIRLDIDCADICTTTFRFIARDSDNVKHLIDECIDLCNLCAEECEKHDSTHCQECARTCKACVEACKSYLNVA